MGDGNECEIASQKPLAMTRNDFGELPVARGFYVYIMTNPRNMVLYTGMTNNLARRAQQHREKVVEGFTKKYNITKLVYFEVFDDPRSAIAREKQLKGGPRQKKVDLVNSLNPEWGDLCDELF